MNQLAEEDGTNDALVPSGLLRTWPGRRSASKPRTAVECQQAHAAMIVAASTRDSGLEQIPVPTELCTPASSCLSPVTAMPLLPPPHMAATKPPRHRRRESPESPTLPASPDKHLGGLWQGGHWWCRCPPPPHGPALRTPSWACRGEETNRLPRPLLGPCSSPQATASPARRPP